MPGKSKSGGGLKTKKYVMQMGTHSEDNDTTFKAKDQDVINNSLLSRVATANSSRSKNRAKVQANNASRIASGVTESVKHMSRSQDNLFSKGASAIYGFAKGFSKKPTTPTSSVPKAPSVTVKPKAPVPAPASPKPYVKKGGKATGSIKNYAVGSDARRKEYDARGWAYDNTIKKPKKTKPAVSSIKPKPTSITSKPKAAALTSAPKTATSTPKAKSSKIKAKGEAALASGNVKKAQRLRKRYDRVAKKEAKKSKPSSPNTQTYTSTLKLPPGSSAFDARGSYSTLAAQNANNAYSQGNFSLSNTNMTYNKKRNEVSLASAYKVKFK
jgi:hypothetical protein